MERIHRSKDGKKGKFKKIGLKIGGVVMVMQMTSVLLVMMVCIFMYNSLVTKMQEVRCTNGTNVLAYELGQLSGDEDMNQFLDGLKSRMGCEFTILRGCPGIYYCYPERSACGGYPAGLQFKQHYTKAGKILCRRGQP